MAHGYIPIMSPRSHFLLTCHPVMRFVFKNIYLHQNIYFILVHHIQNTYHKTVCTLHLLLSREVFEVHTSASDAAASASSYPLPYKPKHCKLPQGMEQCIHRDCPHLTLDYLYVYHKFDHVSKP
jgi:hypothetical protein